MDVAVAIGSDPITCLAGIPAHSARPGRNDGFAGFLQARARCRNGLRARLAISKFRRTPEIVLEGYVDLGEMRTEGPFGDHTGFYSLEGEFPVFHVTCVTQRREPIYLTTIVGPPPQEDFFMGHAVERVFLPVMKM